MESPPAESPLSSKNQNSDQHADAAIRYLYIGHFLSRWGTRMWEFSVALYMINLWPDSLFLAAVYGMVDSASIALFGPLIGSWVDYYPYLIVVKVWLFAQNLSFLIAGGAVIALLLALHDDGKVGEGKKMAFLLMVFVINVSGAVGVLSTLAGTILVEREWVVVISQTHSEEFLTRMNSVIRRIDLFCKLGAPVVSGFIISFASLIASALSLALWNVLSVCLQYWLFMSVYYGIPALSETCSRKRAIKKSSTEDIEMIPLNHSEEECDKGYELKCTNLLRKLMRISCVSAWKVYLKQDVVLSGVSLALLYFNVLSFGTLMTAALEWERIPVYIIGIGRGISAIIGILATFLYPILESRLSSSVPAGFSSVWSQWTCLLICAASIWIPDRFASACTLMGGVALSRLGLWMFDLSVIQQMQDQVPESERCVVGGVQNSLQSIFDLITYVMGMIISDPKDFWKLILISLLVVTHAAALYSLHVYRERAGKNTLWFDPTKTCAYQLVPVAQHQSS
ncbi:OLC1v1012023C1 [Oldenlandia corymbosa var. corymbosa]|uniref:Solute carrier family 40 member n=1 Tax=Oldenlandia corymbosa var. corymbosa TaxID=529605 RepID=A0AAV1DY20_OLDCO|nr:OLC1v1012023C1 [Oldenlandia corymbosa var. corymbosa]